MRPEQLERRSSDEDRARFDELKGTVATQLVRVGKCMPEPWFEELVVSVARLRLRFSETA